MIYFLLTGLILGCIATRYDYTTADTRMRIWALIEMFAVSIIGTFFFCKFLPIGPLPALAMATIFSVVNQVPKCVLGKGSEFREFIESFPPAIFLVALLTGVAWYGAVIGAIQWLIPHAISDGVLPDALLATAANLTGVYFCVTATTLVVGLLVEQIED